MGKRLPCICTPTRTDQCFGHGMTNLTNSEGQSHPLDWKVWSAKPSCRGRHDHIGASCSTQMYVGVFSLLLCKTSPSFSSSLPTIPCQSITLTSPREFNLQQKSPYFIIELSAPWVTYAISLSL